MFGFFRVGYKPIFVEGVAAGYEGRELMKAIVRRNCNIDDRLCDHIIFVQREYEDFRHNKLCDYRVNLEKCDFTGVVKDLSMLRIAGLIKKVRSVNEIV